MGKQIIKPICTKFIVCAKHKKIIGFGFGNLLSVANNAIHNYKEVWHFIEQAFKFYGSWNELMASDTRNTFKGKHQEYLADKNRVKKYEAEAVLSLLFPEVFRPALNRKEWFNPDVILINESGSKSTI